MPCRVVRVSGWAWADGKEQPVTAGAADPAPCFLFSHAGAHIARRRDSFPLHSVNMYSLTLMWGRRDEQNMVSFSGSSLRRVMNS